MSAPRLEWALVDALGKTEPEFGSHAGQLGTGHGVNENAAHLWGRGLAPGAVDSAYLLLPVSSGSASRAESYAGFQPPPHQTQRADFLHWAFLCVSHQGLC